jgi:putative aldouronate transport system permease protein
LKNAGLANRLFDAANYCIISLFTVTILLPFVYMFAISVSDPLEVGNSTVTLWPKGFQLESYVQVFNENQIVRAYWNSIRYTVVGTLLVLTIGCLTAYPLAARDFKAKKFLIVLFTITMFFNGGLIPTFMVIKNLGLLDTLWAVTLPAAFSFWNIIILRTNFRSLPSELYESAFMDGANDWQILMKIVIPLSKPILATIALFASVGLWNAFFGPLIYLSSSDMQPLTIILRRILISNESLSDTEMIGMDPNPILTLGRTVSLRMAVIFVTIGPIVLIYPFVQKYFVQGALVGSVKG